MLRLGIAGILHRNVREPGKSSENDGEHGQGRETVGEAVIGVDIPGFRPETFAQGGDDPLPVEADVDQQYHEEEQADPGMNGSPVVTIKPPQQVGSPAPRRQGESQNVAGDDQPEKGEAGEEIDEQVESWPFHGPCMRGRIFFRCFPRGPGEAHSADPSVQSVVSSNARSDGSGIVWHRQGGSS